MTSRLSKKTKKILLKLAIVPNSFPYFSLFFFTYLSLITSQRRYSTFIVQFTFNLKQKNLF